MRRLLFSWVSWLLLEAILLNTAVALSPVHPRLSQAARTTTAFAQSSSDCSDGLFRNTSSVSRELSVQCERRGKQVFALLYARDFFSQVEGTDTPFHSVLIPVFFSTLLFSPRKLFPPSATDEPFLS